MWCSMQQSSTPTFDANGGMELAIESTGGCLMRSLVFVKIPSTAAAVFTAVAAAQLVNLSFEIPFHQLQLAWTLTRVLIQL